MHRITRAKTLHTTEESGDFGHSSASYLAGDNFTYGGLRSVLSYPVAVWKMEAKDT